MSESDGRWEFWIDRGGTFTDIVGRDPCGQLHVHKLLSENPERYRDAAVEGIRVLLELPAGAAIPRERVRAIKMGTTVATNALLERRGAATLLAITAGFGDALRIADQHRPQLFARRIERPSMLYRRVLEIDERVTADGECLRALDHEQVRRALAAARAEGIEAVAIVLLHGWRFPAHERAVAEIARELGFRQVSVSHELSPLAKLVGRGDTTVVDAYLSPILRRYVAGLREALGRAQAIDLRFMQSNGGLVDAGLFRGKDAILSGPAGGIVGAVATCARIGIEALVGFDMGGTSTDVAHYAGSFERSFETEVAGVRVRAPMLDIHTVAAGGGSICRYEDGRYRVGPESAGADPGPACYRRGGPLTVTDCNVMLGKLQPSLFPRLFGPGGDEAIDVAGVHRHFAELAAAITADSGDRRTPAEVAEGFIAIAVASMAEAIKKISLERGHDLEAHALCCFGGAGGQHACLVAEALGMRTVVIHRLAGVLSAYGMGLAATRVLRERSLERELAAALADGEAERGLAELSAAARDELRRQGVTAAEIEVEQRVLLRYAGSDRPLAVAWPTSAAPARRAAELRTAFASLHRERYGFDLPDEAIVVATLAVEAVAPGSATARTDGSSTRNATAGKRERASDLAPDSALKRASDRVTEPASERASDLAPSAEPARASPQPVATVDVRMAGRSHATPVYRREALRAGHRIAGPAILAEATATTVVEPGWTAELRGPDHLLLTRDDRPTPLVHSDAPADARPDPVRLELFNKLIAAIAEQMGATLRNTAHSVNIKERLDFSCAVFDGRGRLIANAPHMPVHLGSMGASVRAVITARRDDARGIRPGDGFVVNAPYAGGTHLPDLTVITPVFVTAAEAPDFFVASRGHHADIGGTTPGSMPADSRHVDEEGVLFDNFLLVDGGRLRREAVRDHLGSGRWPARDIDQNLADLEAQLAANHRGKLELQRMVARWGLAQVRAYMAHVRDNAGESVRRAIAELAATTSGPRRFRYALDDGSEVVVTLTLDGEARRCRVDFSGSSPQLASNFNAPRAVCEAAVLYVFRTLVDADIPMNEGCLDPIDIIVPPASMLDPRYPAAVVAGNVETSQVICDALYGALGVLAAAQGTMNNLTFGSDRYQYYETVCGGSGAGPGFAGTAAVHTHMTNSRLTDPEVLEQRYPVLLRRFEIRRGSGGEGQWPGGDGVRRCLEFRAPMELVLLANRRRVPPFGAEGGQPGALGRNWIERADGCIEPLGSTARVQVEIGDRFVLETPGGGGWGSATRRG